MSQLNEIHVSGDISADGDSTSATHAHGESHKELVEAERTVVLLVEYSEEIVDHYRRLASGAGMGFICLSQDLPKNICEFSPHLNC